MLDIIPLDLHNSQTESRSSTRPLGRNIDDTNGASESHNDRALRLSSEEIVASRQRSTQGGFRSACRSLAKVDQDAGAQGTVYGAKGSV